MQGGRPAKSETRGRQQELDVLLSRESQEEKSIQKTPQWYTMLQKPSKKKITILVFFFFVFLIFQVFLSFKEMQNETEKERAWLRLEKTLLLV
jgi:hypothetical protein